MIGPKVREFNPASPLLFCLCRLCLCFNVRVCCRVTFQVRGDAIRDRDGESTDRVLFCFLHWTPPIGHFIFHFVWSRAIVELHLHHADMVFLKRAN